MSVDHALCRLLFWNKKKVISDDDFRVVANLETHFEIRRDTRQESGNGEEPDTDPTLAVATNARLATKSNLDLSVIQRLYGAVRAMAKFPIHTK